VQAVILAGGLGTRLSPLTEKIPKVMTQVMGKPFLLHLLGLLKQWKIDNIVLCVGYRAEQIKDFFGDGGGLGIRIRYSEETERLLGTAGALKLAQSLLDSHFFVINGDTYVPLEYDEVERVFIECSKKALMVVYKASKATGIKNNVELDDELMVVKHDKEGLSPDLKYVDAGVLILNREVLGLIEEGCSISLEKGLYPFLIQQRELAAYVTQQRFYDIGTPESLKVFEEFLRGARR
jgi:NDP-sugar pyrophosphorylase family protein